MTVTDTDSGCGNNEDYPPDADPDRDAGRARITRACRTATTASAPTTAPTTTPAGPSPTRTSLAGNTVNIYLASGRQPRERDLSMRTADPPGCARALRDERGFTLIELLVASLAGIIVGGGDQRDRDRLGPLQLELQRPRRRQPAGPPRDGEDHAGAELELRGDRSRRRSGRRRRPGRRRGASGSDASDVVFYSSLADAPTIEPNEVDDLAHRHRPVAAAGHVHLRDYERRRDRAGTWTFATTPTPPTQLHAAAARGAGDDQRRRRSPSSSTTATTRRQLDDDAATPCRSRRPTRRTTAEVTVSFEALPSKADNRSATGAGANFTDSVVLRLTPARATANASNTPCT